MRCSTLHTQRLPIGMSHFGRYLPQWDCKLLPHPPQPSPQAWILLAISLAGWATTECWSRSVSLWLRAFFCFFYPEAGHGNLQGCVTNSKHGSRFGFFSALLQCFHTCGRQRFVRYRAICKGEMKTSSYLTLNVANGEQHALWPPGSALDVMSEVGSRSSYT